jgi:hypothetical protein
MPVVFQCLQKDTGETLKSSGKPYSTVRIGFSFYVKVQYDFTLI